MNSDLENSVKSIFSDLKELRKELNSHKGKYISKNAFRGKVETTSKTWFKYSDQIKNLINSNSIEKYNESFKNLIKLSGGNNLKKSFVENIRIILRDFKADLIIPIQTVSPSNNNIFIDKLLSKIKDPEENEYLKEAFDCLKYGLNRASIVLGWCAGIDRIHKKIEEIGFFKFNNASRNLANQNKGRFKNFNKEYHIESLSELRQIFDNDILWVIEGMQLLDINQHVRLKSCFDMRCHAAHPGEAPITEFNILSFFSDVIEIIISNQKFKLINKR